MHVTSASPFPITVLAPAWPPGSCSFYSFLFSFLKEAEGIDYFWMSSTACVGGWQPRLLIFAWRKIIIVLEDQHWSKIQISDFLSQTQPLCHPCPNISFLLCFQIALGSLLAQSPSSPCWVKLGKFWRFWVEVRTKRAVSTSRVTSSCSIIFYPFYHLLSSQFLQVEHQDRPNPNPDLLPYAPSSIKQQMEEHCILPHLMSSMLMLLFLVVRHAALCKETGLSCSVLLN